jgi:hypothetical protein
MPITLLISLFFWVNSSVVSVKTHKFYVSTTTIEFKTESKTFEITSQIFTDDIESVLRERDEDLSLDPDSNSDQINTLIADYFKKTFRFSSEGNSLNFTFLGREYKNDIVKCYIELQLDQVPDEIELFNGLFFDLFEDQQNIVHFKKSDQRKSFLLHKNKPRVALILKP